MKHVVLAATVLLFGTAAGVPSAAMAGSERPRAAHHKQVVFHHGAGWHGGHPGGIVSDGCCEDGCSADPCIGCGQPCGDCCCLRLIGGVLHAVKDSVRWLLCCDHCDPCGWDGCGLACDGCGGPGECDSCGATDAIGGESYDLVPTPNEVKPEEANPFKDDTMSVVPRQTRVRPTAPSPARRTSARSAAARPQPKRSPVVRTVYEDSGEEAFLPTTDPERKGPRAASERSAVQKAEILRALKQSIR